MDHGVSVNGSNAVPWHLDERFYFTKWVTEKARDFVRPRMP